MYGNSNTFSPPVFPYSFSQRILYRPVHNYYYDTPVLCFFVPLFCLMDDDCELLKFT